MVSVLMSHPDQELKDHLLGVSRWAEGLWAGRNVLIWDDVVLQDLLKIMALSHDFGKATAYFQEYIKSESRKKGGLLKSHALLSAVIGYQLAKHYLADHSYAKKLSFFVYVSIKRHHGNLPDIDTELAVLRDDDIELLKKQVKALDFSLLEKTWVPLYPELPSVLAEILPFTKEGLTKWVEAMPGELKQIRRWWLKNTPDDEPLFADSVVMQNSDSYRLENYFQLLLVYSLLLDADKRQAGVRQYNKEYVELPGNIVDVFKNNQTWLNTELNSLREQAYREIAANLSMADRGSLFGITLPTGLGKTLAAYNFAFKLREKRQLERGTAPKIIYALPFLSVIDQNYEILSEILEEQGLLTGHNVLLKHHHLTDLLYKMKAGDDETEFSPNASKLLIEGWESAVVVTTFVQLWETIIGWRNSSLRRFHNLAHSIIILDEIQALPVPYWNLVQQVLEFLVSNICSDVVLVTATQPQIFTGKTEMLQLVDAGNYFQVMDRVKIEVDLTKQTVAEFFEGVKGEISANRDKRFLFIFNTIASAKEFYFLLNKAVQEPVAFLSTGVVMKERRQRIMDLKDKKYYRLAVSTQLVEAGVDIDFDYVYRDFAPMDSINQAAGRCNRNSLGGGGTVRVIYLVREDKKRSLASMIYNATSLDITMGILQGRKLIRESDLLEIIELYFQNAKEKTLTGASHDLLKAMQELKFYVGEEQRAENMSGVNSFQLIKVNGVRASVFIELDQEAKDVWAEYEDITENCQDFFLRQEKFNRIKKAFYDYVISIYVNEKTELPPEVNNFLYVGNSQLRSYYDQDLGFDTRNFENIL